MTNFYTSVVQHGNSLLVRGYRDGQQYKTKANFSPTLYIKTTDNRPSEWKTLDGIPVHPVKQDSIRLSREFVDRYKGVEGFEVFGQTQYVYQFISEYWPNTIKYDPEMIKVFSIDIETATEEGFPNIELANEEILLITVKDNYNKKIATFGTREYNNTRDDVKYIRCIDEQQMLKEFIVFWQNNYPDVLTSWNIYGFDIPYLVNRMNRILGESMTNRLSPWGIIRDKKIYANGNNIQSYDFIGISTLDYLDLYKKFTYKNQESYRLDYIAEVELGENKLTNNFDTFKDFYTQDWQRFVDYNIHDTELVDRLEDKMKLIELVYTLAFESKINFNDVYSPVRMWDMIIYNYLRDRKIIIPTKSDESEKPTAFEGAYVKDPLVGQHKWVASFDLNSLYPHLIMQYNISPETLTDEKISCTVDKLLNKEVDTEYAKRRNLSLTANGWCYTKEQQGFMPELMEKMYGDRKKFKRQMLKVEQEYQNDKSQKHLLKEISRLHNLQMAMKIALNSAYGAMGNQYFRYFDLRMAEGITTSGQLSIRWMANKLNAFMNKTLKTEGQDYVVAIDTDSIYLTLETLVEKVAGDKDTAGKIKFMDKICEEVFQPFIESGYQELAEYMNAYAQKMVMDREVLADKAIWTAKKRYVMNVHNSEGVQFKEPKVKVMGLEMVKSSTPAVIRDKLRESIPVILTGDKKNLHTFVEDFRKEFMSLPPEAIAFPRGVNGIKKWAGSPIYSKGTPIHVRGSLLFNHHIKRLGLDRKYQPIRDGDKIKFVYVKKPNPFQEDVIAFPSELPKEFALNTYIDYDKQFEKVFTDAIQIVIEPLGWKAQEESSLEDFFG